MGKQKKAKVGGKKKRVKKSFLDLQKRKRNEFEKKKFGKGKTTEESDKPRRAFKFENFSDEIASVDYSIVYQLAGTANINQISEELRGSVFRDTLDHWRELNLTAEFTDIVRRLIQYVTLPQVIYSQSTIVEVLRDGLINSTALSVQPVLELVAGLATDLQQEFYPHLSTFLGLLTTHTLKLPVADVIKWSFRCLGHLLKILWRPVSAHLEEVYSSLCPLFQFKQPDYIRYLGAETVAFLVRKSKNKQDFTQFILSQMGEGTDPVAVSKLLFESVKTVNSQFNGSLEPSLRIFLQILPGEFNAVLKHFYQFSCEHAVAEHIAPILDITCEFIRLNLSDKDRTKILLECLDIIIRTKQGRLVKSVRTLLDYLRDWTNSGCYSDELLGCVSSVIESVRIAKTADELSTAVALVLEGRFTTTQILNFVTKLRDESIFESYVLKPYLGWVQREIPASFDQVSEHLASLLEERNPPCEYGSELGARQSNSLDLNLVPSLRTLKREDLFSNLCAARIDPRSSVETIRRSLVICSSIYPVDRAQVLQRTSAIIRHVLEEQNRELVSNLPLCIQSLSTLSSKTKLVEYIDLEIISAMFLSSTGDNKDVLQALNFALTVQSREGSTGLSSGTLDTLLTRLVLLLSEPRAQVRLLALLSISLLLPDLGAEYRTPGDENSLSVQGLVETMIQAERTAESLAEYKKKINLLQRLEAERLHDNIRNDERLSSIPLRYLLGCLYTNFTLLWAPVQNLVAGYGNYIKRDKFWNVFGAKLVSADEDIEKQLIQMKNGTYDGESKAGKRIDYIKYRNQLWSLLSRFSDVSEAKNRDLVPLFLDSYLKKEYQLIRELSEDRSKFQAYREVINSTIKSLMVHLTVFSHFKDLKSLHRVAEMRTKMDELLCHRVAPVQKLALDVLVAFKLSYLVPYKDNLLRLLEDKDFKSELVAFPLGEETSEIKAEHRDLVLPIVLRLLYGRLRSAKRGKKDGGKGAVPARRTLILHQLLDLSEDHIRYFLDLVFGELYTGCGLEEGGDVFQYILEGGSAPTKSMKQLQAALEMLQSVMAKLGKLMEKNLGYILETIVWVGFTATSLDQGARKMVGYKAVRNSVYSQLSHFFSKYLSFTYTPQAEEAIFKTLVWRPLENFDKDYIHSPSGLLHLVLCWSRQPSHRRFLKRTHPSLKTRILENIVKVLLKSTTATKVVDCVLEVVNNLVTPVEPMESDDVSSEGECGVELVLPEMETLLSHFNSWIQASNKDVKQLKKVGVKLDILTHLAPHISEPGVALTFVNQLFVMLGSIKKPESVSKVIVIGQYLVEKVDQEQLLGIVNLVLPFFGKLATRAERSELSNFMRKVSEMDPALARLGQICVNLNAYDKRRFEEPDFEARMQEFIRIREDLRRGTEFSVEELKAVFYISCFCLQHEKDSSLKSNTLDTLLVLCTGVQALGGRDLEAARRFINKVCLEQIKRGLKSKDDMVRCDFISVLHKLVLSCQDCNARLKDLSKLTSPEDIDSDFFENIRHVQLHRRGRALTRLAKQLQENPKLVSERNLTQLLLPVCTTYLLNPDYVKHSQLVEQAIQLLGAVCSTLPWAQYEIYVRYYTSLFNKETAHQRQLVKITTEVLNAFHFPLDLQEEVEEKEKELRRRIHATVNSSLLPKLTATLSGKTKGPVSLSDEDLLIQRVPLAVPIVRILQLNPVQTLEREVPGIIAKIASFLKSKAIEIREAARNTLCSVMELLGPRFISFAIRELSSFLTKGYQVHVLTYTVHTMLHNLSEKNILKPGDLDGSVNQLTDLALSEMFGVTAEEKEVKKITGKLLEAKNTKSYDTMQMTARYLSSSQLMHLVKPFSDKLNNLSAFKNIIKIKECLRNIVVGLLANPALDPNFAMVFVFGVLTDQIKLGRKQTEKKEKKVPVYVKPDTFIVQRAPKRGGAVAKTAVATSLHVIHEFGLNLLYFLLKRGSLDSNNEEHCARLDPFFPVLTGFLSSSHASVITVALRCFQWFVKMPLESKTDDNLLDLTNSVFGLLKKYGGGTDGKGENHDLVVMASKLLVILIRDVKITQIKDDQLKMVFDYILVDILDPLKQTTAFGLLSAVLGRKLVSPDLHEIMLKLVEMSIQSTSQQVRQSAKSAVVCYVANYELKKKLGRIVDVYVAQLGYQQESGRLMAADAIKSIITTLGQGISGHAQFLFVSLAPHLINDESEECRRAVAGTLGALLTTLKEGGVETLKRSALTWFQADNKAHAQLACRLLIIFLDTLGLKILKPELGLIEQKLVSLVQSTDALCIQALSLLQRLVRLDSSNLFWKSRLLCDGVQNCLLHPHAWVRLLSAQLLGLYLARLPDTLPGQLVWLSEAETLRSIILDSLEQLNLAETVGADLSLQVVKNLVALTRLILPHQAETINLRFVLKKAVKISNHELITNTKCTVRRTLVFNYIAAVCLHSTEAEVRPLLRTILPPLQRELSSSGTASDLRTHCQEVLDLVKTKVEDEDFSRTLLEVQLDISKKRGERTAAKKQNLILHPNLAAKRKIQQNEAKRAAKKARRLKN